MKILQAITDKVIVEIISENDKTIGGIVIPETVQENKPYRVGRIVSVGKKVEELEPNDIISFAKFGGQDTMLNGKMYKVLGLGEIYGKIIETD